MTERRYLPTIADLIDRLSITLMKSIFIDRNTYRAEMKLIMDDLNRLMPNCDITYAVLVLMLANRFIWDNEGKVRAGGKVGRLRYTHAVNGVRNRAKNEINKIFGERLDQKIDCLAADLPTDCGDWRVFDD